ncbi:MAG TPA: hypothetical protein VK821_15085 [Dehalococcoidia bacterium]|nr:hypothetical protein [Dehalococcoidia bacterium]
MIKLLILVALGVGGYFIVRRILSDDTGAVEAEHSYGAPETSQPAN